MLCSKLFSSLGCFTCSFGNRRQMGINDYISSTVDSVKRNTPGLNAVKSLCWSSYGYRRAAVTSVHNAVACNGKAVVEKVNQHLSDEETRSEITTNLIKNSTFFAFNEGIKLIPGGSVVAHIVGRSLPNDKKKSRNDKELQELKDKVDRMEKELNDYKKSVQSTEAHKRIEELKTNTTLDHQKPEDVIRHFMMMGNFRNPFLDNLLVTGVGSRKPPSTKHTD